ncbi:MAG: hypothetical protein HYZ92_00670, partial [Candidatus Omnitrophica bacterium]|nr:hypothetical protein [Candidatus Omnitrophota bacterium]
MFNRHSPQEGRRQKAEGRKHPALLTAYCLLLTAYCCLVTGCAVIGPVSRKVPPAQLHVPELLDDGYAGFTGVLHIHTVYSDGSGTFEEIARAANQQQL